jgi:hypothetical protein
MPPENEQDPINKAVGEKADEALRIAKEIEDKLNNPPPPKEEPEPDVDPATLINSPDFKTKAKETTGMTDAQVDFVIKTANVASANANETAAIAEVRSRHPDFAKHEAAIKAELKQYPLDKRGNQAIVEKLYYVEKGKDAEKNPGRSDNGGRMSLRGSGPTGQGLDNGGRGKSGSESLDDEERYVARKMGIKEIDYAKAKTTKLVNDLIE